VISAIKRASDIAGASSTLEPRAMIFDHLGQKFKEFKIYFAACPYDMRDYVDR